MHIQSSNNAQKENDTEESLKQSAFSHPKPTRSRQISYHEKYDKEFHQEILHLGFRLEF